MNIPTFEEVWRFTEPISEHAMRPDEVQRLYDLCSRVPKNGLIIEVGCQLGRSSSVIAQVGKAVGYRSLHIDPYMEGDNLKAWVAMMHSLDYPFVLLRMRTEQAAYHLENYGGVDLAFIDGNHEQEAVEIDLRLVAVKIKRGGELIAHDYGTDAHIGVKCAIDPYVADGRWEYEGTTYTMGTWRRK